MAAHGHCGPSEPEGLAWSDLPVREQVTERVRLLGALAFLLVGEYVHYPGNSDDYRVSSVAAGPWIRNPLYFGGRCCGYTGYVPVFFLGYRALNSR
jgi:hypothetical protein